jgi:tape measure domain-containing protein
MEAATASAGKMDQTMSGLGGKLAGAAATLGIGALAKEMVMTGAKFDSYKARLETLLGSQEKASIAFEQIKKNAAKTPFDVASLTEANAMLISSGASAEGARHMVMGLGNAIAATGGGSDELSRMAVNLQQIKTLGKASAMDIKQFAFAGIPIYQMLSKTLGKSIEQVREMDVTYEQLEEAFTLAAKKGGMFAGGLEKQSKSIGGQLSNLGDQFTNTMVEFYEKLKPLITDIIGMLSKLLAWVSRNKETIIFFGKIITLVGAMVVAYKSWIMVTGLMEAAQIALNTAMSLNPIGAVIAAVVALTAALMALIDSYKEAKSVMTGDMERGKGFDQEIRSVNALAERYEKLGMSKEKAMQTSINFEKKELTRQAAELQTKISKETDEEKKRALQRQMFNIGGQMSALADSKKLISEYASGSSNAGGGSNASSKSASVKSVSSGAVSSTDISSARPQSIVINVTKLVEKLDINTTNIKEGADKIKEMVSVALMEALNDANAMAKA